VQRLKGVAFDCMDAGDFIVRYDGRETLFYLDPPYMIETRKRVKSSGYWVDMTDEQHLALLQLLLTVEGMVVISGYRCELYDGMLAGWRRVDRDSRTDGRGSAVESLWLNGQLDGRLRGDLGHLPLFGGRKDV